MLAEVRSLARRAWPLLGTLYLGYLAFQSPPVNYVGMVGLAVVTPLLVGWVVGGVFGVGPWSSADEDESDDEDVGDGEDVADVDDIGNDEDVAAVED